MKLLEINSAAEEKCATLGVPWPYETSKLTHSETLPVLWATPYETSLQTRRRKREGLGLAWAAEASSSPPGTHFLQQGHTSQQCYPLWAKRSNTWAYGGRSSPHHHKGLGTLLYVPMSCHQDDLYSNTASFSHVCLYQVHHFPSTVGMVKPGRRVQSHHKVRGETATNWRPQMPLTWHNPYLERELSG